MAAFPRRRGRAIVSGMNRQTDDGQRRDKLLLRLLKAPPRPRPKRERDKEKPTQTRAKRASAGKPAPSA
jgi:hypothetical protein